MDLHKNNGDFTYQWAYPLQDGNILKIVKIRLDLSELHKILVIYTRLLGLWNMENILRFG